VFYRASNCFSPTWRGFISRNHYWNVRLLLPHRVHIKKPLNSVFKNRDSWVSIVTGIWAGRPRNWDSLPSRAKGNQFFIVQIVSWVYSPSCLVGLSLLLQSLNCEINWLASRQYVHYKYVELYLQLSCSFLAS